MTYLFHSQVRLSAGRSENRSFFHNRISKLAYFCLDFSKFGRERSAAFVGGSDDAFWQ
jgi:hypothetical protein